MMEEAMLLLILSKISKILITSLLLIPLIVYAQTSGFESGDLSGWTSSDSVTVVGSDTHLLGGKEWVVNPYGTYMARLYPGGSTMFDTANSQLGLSSVENTAIKDFLILQSQTGGGNPTPTNASWIKQSVELEVGVTYTFAWNYLSTDYTPFNDGSMITLVHATNNGIIPTLNNEQQRYALLGFTNPGTGNYSTGSYGSTGWQVATITVPETGMYFLGFSAFNLGDTVLSPLLFIDELQGSTLLNGQNFDPIEPNEGSVAPIVGPSNPEPVYGSTALTTQQSTRRSNNFSQTTGHDAQVDIIGNNNDIFIEQIGTSGHFSSVDVDGDGNDISVSQVSTLNGRHYTEVTVSGSSNIVDITQRDTDKTQFININGNSNNVVTSQTGTGNHFLDLTISGSDHSATILQSGSGNHGARILLEGSQPWDFTLNQSGETDKTYTLPHTMSDGSTVSGNCAAVGGCSLTVNQ